MYNGTINGKPVNTILAELAADLPLAEVKTDYQGISYFTVDTFRNRLDNIVGINHYNEIYQTEYVNAKNTIGISVKCRLEILDDDYDVIFVKEAGGGGDVNFAKNDKGEPLQTTNSFHNNHTSACQDAFKKACYKLGIGAAQRKIIQKGEAVTLCFAEPVSYSGDKGYFKQAYINGQLSKLAVFKNKLAEFKKVVPNGTQAGCQIVIYGKWQENGNYGAQFVFNSF